LGRDGELRFGEIVALLDARQSSPTPALNQKFAGNACESLTMRFSFHC
jgi:hypothetical protein